MNTTTTALTVTPGLGCGTGSDGAPCSPAYLCPDCIQLLLNADSDDDVVLTPATSDTLAWIEAEFPEGDAHVQHTGACDLVSCGDECQGGCPVVIES